MPLPHQDSHTPSSITTSQQSATALNSPHNKSSNTLYKLMKDIAAARKMIATHKASLDASEKLFTEKVGTLQTRTRALRLEIFQVLCGHVKSGRIKKRLESQLKDALIDFAYFLKDAYGADLIVEMATTLGDGMHTDEEEEVISEFEAQLGETFDQAFWDMPNSQNHKQKTTAHLTPQNTAEEQAITGDIRALYLLLARALHPDKETDENQRTEKTKWMQKVTKAYGEKNLAELLDILGENPLNALAPYLSQAPAKTIYGFTKRLKHELTALELEAKNIFAHMPDFIREFFHPTGEINLPRMNQEIKGLKRHVQDLEKKRTELRTQVGVERIIPLFKNFKLAELL